MRTIDRAARIIAALALALGPVMLMARPVHALPGGVYPVEYTTTAESSGWSDLQNSYDHDGLTFAVIPGQAHIDGNWYLKIDLEDDPSTVRFYWGGCGNGGVYGPSLYGVPVGGSPEFLQYLGCGSASNEWIVLAGNAPIDYFFVVTNNPGFFGDAAIPNINTPPATSTPTAPPIATSIPVANACIPADLVPQATATYPVRTPTPFGTRTLAPTSTPGPTTTPVPQGVIEHTTFDFSLSPWTTNGLAGWSSAPGPDTRTGIAMLPFTVGATITETGSSMLTAPNDALIIERPYLPRPWRLSGDIQLSSGIPANTYAYLQIFEWRDGGIGLGGWYLVANHFVNVGWHTWTYTNNAPDTVRAIALRAIHLLSPITNPLGAIPQDNPGVHVQVDNLRLAAGQNVYNSPSAAGLPVCGPNSTPAEPQTVCKITRVPVNVFKCQKPESLLEIGGWIGYLWCNIKTYFKFLPENEEQVISLQERQSRNEPFGLLLEMPGIGRVTSDSLRAFTRQYATTSRRDIDWGKLLDLNAIRNLQLPAYNDPVVSPVPWAPCDLSAAGGLDLSETDERLACALLDFSQQSQLFPVFQFLISLASVVMVINYIYARWIDPVARANS